MSRGKKVCDSDDSDDDYEMIAPNVVEDQQETAASPFLSREPVPTTESGFINDSEKERSKHRIAQCHVISCKLEHTTREEEIRSERAIEPLLKEMQKTAQDSCTGQEPIFRARLSDNKNIVFDTFVAGLPNQYRQIMNCSCCKQFLRQYGNLCIVGDNGQLKALMWPHNAVPEYYNKAVRMVLELFETAALNNEFRIFAENGRQLGTPVTNRWNHMSISLPNMRVLPRVAKKDAQDTETSFAMLDRILSDFTMTEIQRAHQLITNNQLPYATTHKAPFHFLLAAATAVESATVADDRSRKNLITRLARSAFPGCISSLRGGLPGYLLECVQQSQDYQTIKKQWETKADPFHYMRPTAAPSSGNIQSAERMFADLGYTENDLGRAFLTLDQVPSSGILWSPSSTKNELAEEKAASLFGHLKPKSVGQDRNIGLPYKSISFRKFALDILPSAKSVSLNVPSQAQMAFFTVGRPGSKPLMAWHTDTNTAAWYFWGMAHSAKSASLESGFVPVTSIVSFPHMWDHLSTTDGLDSSNTATTNFKFARHDVRYLFSLQGVQDTRPTSLALFPTCMRGEFHGVRKTVEAFSAKGKIDVPANDKERVGGIAVSAANTTGIRVEVEVADLHDNVTRYRIVVFE